MTVRPKMQRRHFQWGFRSICTVGVDWPNRGWWGRRRRSTVHQWPSAPKAPRQAMERKRTTFWRWRPSEASNTEERWYIPCRRKIRPAAELCPQCRPKVEKWQVYKEKSITFSLLLKLQWFLWGFEPTIFIIFNSTASGLQRLFFLVYNISNL